MLDGVFENYTMFSKKKVPEETLEQIDKNNLSSTGSTRSVLLSYKIDFLI